jgi:hypothetical protein
MARCWAVGSVLALAAITASATSGCVPTDETAAGIGLTGFVGVEVAPELVGGIPTLAPVAVLLSPYASRASNVRALAGAPIELWVGTTRLARTSTDANGIWALPRRYEQSGSFSAYTPAGLFGTLAPAPVVSKELVALGGLGPLPWPPATRRVAREQIVDDISIIIEGANAR